jgi:predicted transport protein
MKIFQNKNGKLIELKETKEGKKYFDYEKTIQTIVEKNIGEILTGLEFVKSEYKIDDFRIDSVAFDNEKKSFAIIEYKNVENTGLVDQGVTYYDLLQKHKADFVLLYNELKGKALKLNDIEWDEIRIIFISPFFNKFQIKASNFQGLPIELYEIRKYEDEIVTLNKIENKEAATHHPQKTVSKERERILLAEYSEEDYLAGKYQTQIPLPQIREIWFKLKNKISDNFEKGEFKQKKKYSGFYSKEDGSLICTLEATKARIKLCYTTRKNKGILTASKFVRDVSKIGHWGVGDYQSEIKTEGDIENALPLIRKVYEEKVRFSR